MFYINRIFGNKQTHKTHRKTSGREGRKIMRQGSTNTERNDGYRFRLWRKGKETRKTLFKIINNIFNICIYLGNRITFQFTKEIFWKRILPQT